jgi:hypothetical protein
MCLDAATALMERYIELAKFHGLAASEFDFKKANRVHSRVMKIHQRNSGRQ